MATILYLDIDDEITTAAARIRASSETKVALVLPPGSRLATSRMNFRLLAREALERNRVLTIVAADPAARALAGSAGLPAHGSVQEFEAAIAPPSAAPAVQPPNGPVEPAGAPEAPRRRRKRATATGAGSAGAEAAEAPTVVAPEREGSPGEAAVVEAPAAEASAATAPTIAVRTVEPASAAPPVAEPRPRSGAAALPVVAATRLRREPGLARWLAIGGVSAALAVALAIVAFLILPSATVVVTPKAEPIGPIEVVVRADPDAPAVDAVAGVVPATRLTKDFEASDEFKATGKRVVQTKAKGTLRWTNCDPTKAYTIPVGTVAKTKGGIGFASNEAVFLPVAIIVPPSTIKCQSRDVTATAAKAGPSGNVPAGSVTVVPSNYNSVVIKVTNPDPMKGGKRDEFTRVAQKDVDAAIASLTEALEAQFRAWATAPDDLPPGATVYPATRHLADPTATVDPVTLVGVEEPTFQLGLTSTGSVVGVDHALVEQVGAERIAASVPADHTLRSGSAAVDVGTGVADGEIVDFRATASAESFATLDPEELRGLIKGKPVDEARSILSAYGAVTIETWPGYVTSIPSLDARLDLTVAGVDGAAPTPEPTEPAPSATPP